MPNLLTPETKKILLAEQRGRRIIVVLWLLGALILIGLVLNASLWFSLKINKDSLAGEILKSDPTHSASASSLEEAKELENNLKQLITWLPGQNWNDVLGRVLSLKTSTIKISQITAERSVDGQTDRLALMGQAGDRQSLVDFANRLKQDKFFTKVDLPFNDLLSENNYQFTITLEFKDHGQK